MWWSFLGVFEREILRDSFGATNDNVRPWSDQCWLALSSETWVLSKCDEAVLGVFEREILRVSFGPTYDNGEWRINYNNKLYTLYKESDIVTYINTSNAESNSICLLLALLGAYHFFHVSGLTVKINRLKWAGHVARMEEQSATGRVLVAVVEGRKQSSGCSGRRKKTEFWLQW